MQSFDHKNAVAKLTEEKAALAGDIICLNMCNLLAIVVAVSSVYRMKCTIVNVHFSGFKNVFVVRA